MKLAISHDEKGNITTLFDPEKLRSEKFTVEYVPAKGERHHVLDVPKELESKPFTELPGLLRVDASGARPKLVAKA